MYDREEICIERTFIFIRLSTPFASLPERLCAGFIVVWTGYGFLTAGNNDSKFPQPRLPHSPASISTAMRLAFLFAARQ